MDQSWLRRRLIHQWVHSPAGRSLVASELSRLAAILPGLYGPIALQVGRVGFPEFLGVTDAVTRILAADELSPTEGVNGVAAVPEVLPFEAKSIGLMLLPHVLEFTENPHQVLREASRILVPEGHLIVLGFNPWSLWGLRRLVARGDRAPWNGRFYRLSRVKDWLALLEFEVISGSMICYRPSIGSDSLRERLRFMESAGDRWWPLLGGTYLLVARKREIGVTPIRPAWARTQRLAPGLVEPVARNA